MGVKRVVVKSELERVLDFKIDSIEPTLNGVVDTTYILNRDSILKIYEEFDRVEIESELKLLELIGELKTPKPKSDIFYIQNRVSLIFSKIEGVSLKRVENHHIKQIAIFLKKFHKITKNRDRELNLFSKEQLKEMVLRADREEFYKLFDEIKDIDYSFDGVIHGDLFLDNAKFKNGVLSGVFDFSQSSRGSFKFDLAVVALSWCFDKNSLNRERLRVLIDSYDDYLTLKKISIYIKYALLFYAVNRYLTGAKDYRECLIKFKNLKKVL